MSEQTDSEDFVAIERKFLHDINNQLAIIDGRLRILEKNIAKPESPEREEAMKKSFSSLYKAKDNIVELVKVRREQIIS